MWPWSYTEYQTMLERLAKGKHLTLFGLFINKRCYDFGTNLTLRKIPIVNKRPQPTSQNILSIQCPAAWRRLQ
jgi:hypothetical protein